MKIEYTPPGDGEEKKERPDLLKPGWHSFEVLNCYTTNHKGEELITSEGDPYLKLRAEEAATGAIIYHSLFFSEKGGAKLNAFLFATGLAGNRGEIIDLSPSDFEGKRFRGLVGMENYNGRQYNKIDLVKPFEQERPEEPEIDEVPF